MSRLATNKALHRTAVPLAPQPPVSLGVRSYTKETQKVMRHRVLEWVKNPARTLTHAARRATSRYRSLPDFIIIGAQKSGTSSLFSYMSQHPEVLPSSKKEVHYFDGGLDPNVDTFEKGELWYRSHFPLEAVKSNGKKTFEASPLYVFNPLVPQRIHKLVPDAKLVLILRDPVERTISHYFNSRREGYENLSIDNALQCEHDRINEAIENEDYKDRAFHQNSYKSRSIYHVQIKRFLEYFPRDQLLVLGSEDFFANPNKTIQGVCKFVGVRSDAAIPDLHPRNVGSNREKVDEKVYTHLKQYFAPYNHELYELIGKNFGW